MRWNSMMISKRFVWGILPQSGIQPHIKLAIKGVQYLQFNSWPKIPPSSSTLSRLDEEFQTRLLPLLSLGSVSISTLWMDLLNRHMYFILANYVLPLNYFILEVFFFVFSCCWFSQHLLRSAWKRWKKKKNIIFTFYVFLYESIFAISVPSESWDNGNN